MPPFTRPLFRHNIHLYLSFPSIQMKLRKRRDSSHPPSPSLKIHPEDLPKWVIDPRNRLEAIPHFHAARVQKNEYRSAGRKLDGFEISFFSEGRVSGTISGKNLNAGPGDLLLIPPMEPHDLIYAKGLYIHYMRFRLFDPNGRRLRLSRSFVLRKNIWSARKTFGVLLGQLDEVAGGPPERFRAALCLLLCEFFAPPRKQRPAKLKRFSESTEIAIRDRVSRASRGELTTKSLAKDFSFPPAEFQERFKTTFGESPRTWIVREHLREAIDLLVEGKGSIREIAQKMGYDNPFLFSRLFKKYFGSSPIEFRSHPKG